VSAQQDRVVDIGDRLRVVREKHGFNQYDMAHKVGVTQSRVSDWEHGKYMPTLATLGRYADALEITLAQLLEGVL
jgi:transcriptional regulator with XRE-family HTH domain